MKTTYVYVFDYRGPSIHEIKIIHGEYIMTNEQVETILDFDFGFPNDEISYLISTKELSIHKNPINSYA